MSKRGDRPLTRSHAKRIHFDELPDNPPESPPEYPPESPSDYPPDDELSDSADNPHEQSKTDTDTINTLMGALPPEARDQLILVRDKMLIEMLRDVLRHSTFRVCPKGNPLDKETMLKWNREFRRDKRSKLIQQVIHDLPVSYVSTTRDRLQDRDYTYSHDIPEKLSPTDQLQSGRCWIFAGLNAMRVHAVRHHNLDKKFELSSAHLFFHDKLERCNYFMETMLRLKSEGRDWNDAMVRDILTTYHPISDGGTWEYFKNLVKKYGVMPKTNYDECYNTMVSSEMNKILKLRLNEIACEIMSDDSSDDDQLRSKKDSKWMKELHGLVSKFMGAPSKKFDWVYYDAHSVRVVEKNLTPVDFYQRFIEPAFTIDSKIVLMHDPRHPTLKTYYVEHSGNMVGGQMDQRVNVDMKTLKSVTKKSIKNRDPCWFSCDVEKCSSMDHDILDDKAFDFELILGTKFNLNKEQSLIYRTSAPTHAMLMVGIDIRDGKTIKWRAENSWGGSDDDDSTRDPGHLAISDSWFSRYVYEVVVDRKFIKSKILDKIDFDNPVKLDYHDPLGGAWSRM